jgi:IS605 OrfB family transposase
MKLILKIKLNPTTDQSKLLYSTIIETNLACNAISQDGWDNEIFKQFKLHHLCYYKIKKSFNLTSQIVVRAISKVSDAYKVNKTKLAKFKELGSICYDSRVLKYKSDAIVDIWTVGGRQKIRFSYHNKGYFPYIKGEADLVYKKGKFYLFQTIEFPEPPIESVQEFIGVDLGLTDIAVTSDGIKHSADRINNYREKRQNIRSSIQRKGTKGAKKLLKRLSGRESTTATIINHTISKSIVESAKNQNKGISIEDLTNIRTTSKRRNRKFRTKLGRWSFYQLRSFLEYKSRLSGVRFVVVNPAYTSQTCSSCYYIGTRTNKSFKCKNCGNNMDADANASLNIATLGAVINQPEKSEIYSCAVHF